MVVYKDRQGDDESHTICEMKGSEDGVRRRKNRNKRARNNTNNTMFA